MTVPAFGFPPDLRDEESLRELLAALNRYGFSIDDVKSPEVRERLRALEAQEGRATQ
jgi:hypothetical protein